MMTGNFWSPSATTSGCTGTTYTVTFNTDGGSAVQSQSVCSGQKATKPSDPTKTGSVFAGWYTAATGGTTFNFETTNINSNTTIYARWTASTVTLTLNANGGTVTPTSITINSGSTLGTLPVPTRTGYTFDGWFSQQNGTGTQYTANSTLSANATAYAKWTASTVTLTLNADGGTVTPTSITINSGSTLGTLPVPTRTGYTFDGWFSQQNGTGTQYTANSTLSANATAYAKWTVSTVTLTLNADGGTVTPTSITVNSGSTLGTLPVPTRTGYTFDGWFSQQNGTGTQYTANSTLNANATAYARWTANTYAVTFDRQNGTGGSANVTVTYGAAMPTATAPTRTGYTFGGYYTGTNSTGTQYYTATMTSARNCDLTSATTLYASWTANTYTITLDRQSGTGGSASVTATYDSAMPTATAPTRTGYTFGGYYTGTNGTGTQYYTATMTSARNCDLTSATTLYANWTASTVTLTLNPDGGTVTPTSITVNSGSTLGTLPTPTRTGYTFTGWFNRQNSGGTQYTANSILNANATAYARWTATSYNITYNVNGGSTVQNRTYTITSNAITLPVTTRNGYTFAGWYENPDLTGNAVTTIPTGSTGDKQFYAKWNAVNYDIIYVLDNGVNAPENPLTYTIEHHIILQDPAKNGYEFDGWKEGNEVQAGSTGTKTFTAIWKIPTGVSSSSSIAALQIYPNPAKDGNFNVILSDSETAVLTIINQQGQIVYSTVVDNGFASINTNLETGVYIVSIQSENGLKKQKLIIK